MLPAKHLLRLSQRRLYATKSMSVPSLSSILGKPIDSFDNKKGPAAKDLRPALDKELERGADEDDEPETEEEKLRKRVQGYKKMLEQRPKVITIQFTEKRTNAFATFFVGKYPNMHFLTGFSVGRILKVSKRNRRSVQNTKAFVEKVMRLHMPIAMGLKNATVIDFRIKGTRKIARPLLSECRLMLQDQMKEVKDTGSLSHPLWTIGSIKNITPYDMGSHKKRKRWRYL